MNEEKFNIVGEIYFNDFDKVTKSLDQGLLWIIWCKKDNIKSLLVVAHSSEFGNIIVNKSTGKYLHWNKLLKYIKKYYFNHTDIPSDEIKKALDKDIPIYFAGCWNGLFKSYSDKKNTIKPFTNLKSKITYIKDTYPFANTGYVFLYAKGDNK